MRSIAVLFALAGALLASAQDTLLKGMVTDSSTHEPLIGVNVTYAPGKGTVTDAFGKYSMPIPAGEHTITFSYVGYRTLTRYVSAMPANSWTLDVRMSQSMNQLDMVVVTAGRYEQRVGEVTQSLSVLRPNIVLNKNVVSMDQALDQVPGVVVVDDEPQIRSGSGFSYGAGSRVQVLVDDMPILSGDIGRPNWTFLPLENLEQVEVIKGASSVLYGSAALSGVINVRTAYPRSEPRTRITMFGGVYGDPGNPAANWWGDDAPLLGGANFFHSRQVGHMDLVLGGNAYGDAGFVGPERIAPDTLAADPLRTSPSGYEQRVRFNTSLRWRNRRVQGLTYGIGGNVMKSRSSSVFIWDDTEAGLYRPEPGTTTTTRGTQYYVDPHMQYHAPGGMRHILRGRFHHQSFDNDNEQSNSNETLFGEYQVQQQVDLFGETMFTGGITWRGTRSTAELYTGGAEADGRNTSSNAAAYLQVDKKLIERITLTAGVRYEQFTVNDEGEGQPVFSTGITARVARATYVRGSYGQGFRYPTIGERFIRTSVGQLNIYPNPELRAERSWNMEGGVKQGFKLGGFMGCFDAVVFRQDFEDYVEFTFGQWAPNLGVANLLGLGFKSLNTGGARVTGFELELTGRGTLGAVELGVLMGYTRTLPVSTTPDQVYSGDVPPGSTWPEATYRSTSYDPTDNILKFRIQNLFRGDVQGTWNRWMAGVSVRYNSHVRNLDKIFVDLDTSPPPLQLRTGVKGWMETHRTGDTLVDVRLGFDLSESVRIAALVNNLTNEVYALRPLAIESPRNVQLQLTMEL